jgi:hypothetical protein
MKPALFLPFIIGAFGASLQAQSLYKCSTPEGGTEYRNTPCEKSQRGAGAINKGTVTTVTSTSSPSLAASDTPSAFGLIGLSSLSNPIKAMRDDAAPIDTMAIGLCKSEGGYYVQGAGCLSEPPKNRNPAIGESKMRDICKQTGQTYVKQLNDCVAAAKKTP